MSFSEVLQILNTVGQLGTVGVVLTVGWYFLKYMKDKDDAANLALRDLAKEVKTSIVEFKSEILGSLHDNELRHLETQRTLLELTRETVQTVGQLSGSIVGLSSSIQEQRRVMEEQRLAIQELRAAYESLQRTTKVPK